MATPRRSARVAASDASPVYTDPPATGTKRKSDGAGASPSAKRGKKAARKEQKEQKTIEESMDLDQNKMPAQDAPKDAEPLEENPVSSDDKPQEAAEDAKPDKLTDAVSDAPVQAQDDKGKEAQKLEEQPNGSAESKQEATEVPEEKGNTQSAQETSMMDGTGAFEPKEDEQKSKSATNGDAVDPKAREGYVPSSILEKGVVYFFFRARVNVSDPHDISDIARSYMVLRPIPHGAKLGGGTIGDDGNCRLIAIPKKVLPASGKDRFMAFVETAKASFPQLKNDFMSASEHATKTAGTSHTPPVTPLAEGVYAITTTGRESHLAYMISIPSEIGEVQKDAGIKKSGSFIVSTKNPKFPGPANANIGKDPGYPDDIMQEFRNLRWMPLQPKLLDYEGTQFLLIGESGGVQSATEQIPRDEKKGKDTPLEEMEKLEGEDEIRVKHLKGDDAVFVDLGLSKKEYPQVPTTW